MKSSNPNYRPAVLEKPTQPPPSIPNRPPPIGFLVAGMQLDSPACNANVGGSTNNLNSNSNTTILSCSSSSAISSSSQEILNSTTTTTSNNNNISTSSNNPPVKGPKPAVPRRPTGNLIATHLKQFDANSESGSQQHVTVQNKSSSEITSLWLNFLRLLSLLFFIVWFVVYYKYK